jgi:hypothetical protein
MSERARCGLQFKNEESPEQLPRAFTMVQHFNRGLVPAG